MTSLRPAFLQDELRALIHERKVDGYECVLIKDLERLLRRVRE